ncbi:hypothetical protein lpa_03070 [Legionella pneumophila 2300/99 Alcoy]|nr:hypothetical protein lpa_03070 [Legionella pneumophila 2300/99 Alcoy]
MNIKSLLHFFANQDLIQAEQNQNRQIQDVIVFLYITKNYLYAKQPIIKLVSVLGCEDRLL